MQELGDVMEHDTLEGSFCGAMIEWCAAGGGGRQEGATGSGGGGGGEAEARCGVCLFVCRMWSSPFAVIVTLQCNCVTAVQLERGGI